MSLTQVIRRQLSHFVFFVSDYPSIFPSYIILRDFILRDNKRRMLYSKDTELVIEGFPRAANTFAVLAFDFAQSRPVKIAHHLHAPSQVIRGVRDNKPVLLLVRRPEDAVTSFIIMNDRLEPKDALTYYIRFHERLQPYTDRCVVASFESVIKRYDKVLTKLNERFSTQFGIFEPTPENIEECFGQIAQVFSAKFSVEKYGTHIPKPSSDRTKLKKKLLYKIENDYHKLIDSARSIYSEYAAMCVANDS